MRLSWVIFCVTCAMGPANVYAQEFEACGPVTGVYGQYGPFDYRTDKERLPQVEHVHFNSNVENLIQGQTGRVGADIDYTLRAFPNHHRALMSMVRLAEQSRMERPLGASYTVTCYFDRALRFRPDDGTVRVLFANWLAKHGKTKEAAQQLKATEQLLGANANLHYNAGLTYVMIKDYDKALQHAHYAYKLGFPLPGLRNQLERAGKWRQPSKEDTARIAAPVEAAAIAAPAESRKAEVPAPTGESAAKP